MLATEIVIHANQCPLNLGYHGFGRVYVCAGLGVRIFLVAVDSSLMGSYRFSDTGITGAAIRRQRRCRGSGSSVTL